MKRRAHLRGEQPLKTGLVEVLMQVTFEKEMMDGAMVNVGGAQSTVDVLFVVRCPFGTCPED